MVRKYTHTYSHTTQAYKHSHIHSLIPIHTEYTQAHQPKVLYTCTHTSIHTSIHTFACDTSIHTHHMHAGTHIHVHTYTHTHTQIHYVHAEKKKHM